MKIYKWEIMSDRDGTLLGYAASKRQAIHDRSEQIKAQNEQGDLVSNPRVSVLEITPTKAGIIEFLNLHTPTIDNG